MAALEARRIKVISKSGGYHVGRHSELDVSEEGAQSEDDASTEDGIENYGPHRQGATEDETSRFFAVAWALEILR